MNRFRIVYWIVLLSTVAIGLWMSLHLMPTLEQLTGGLPVFDGRYFGYDFAQARGLLSALESGDGLSVYTNELRRFDMVFPLLMTLSLVGAYKGLASGSIRWILTGVAVAYTVFDYAENTVVGQMIAAGSDGISASIVATASRLTVLKFGSLTIAVLALIILAAAAILRRNRAAGQKQ